MDILAPRLKPGLTFNDAASNEMERQIILEPCRK
jgi:hypothetical protein